MRESQARSHYAASAAGRQGWVEILVGRVVLLDGKVHVLEPLREAAPAVGATVDPAVAQEHLDAMCCKCTLESDSNFLDALPIERALPLLFCEHVLLEHVVSLRRALLREKRYKLRGCAPAELTCLE